MTDRLSLGYRTATACRDTPVLAAGGKVRGHEFHYASTTEAGNDAPLARLTDAAGRDLGVAGARRGLVSGSFFHAIAPAA